MSQSAEALGLEVAVEDERDGWPKMAGGSGLIKRIEPNVKLGNGGNSVYGRDNEVLKTWSQNELWRWAAMAHVAWKSALAEAAEVALRCAAAAQQQQ